MVFVAQVLVVVCACVVLKSVCSLRALPFESSVQMRMCIGVCVVLFQEQERNASHSVERKGQPLEKGSARHGACMASLGDLNHMPLQVGI